MLKGRAPYWRITLIPIARAADLLRQIRHNLVAPEKPFFRRGRCVVKSAHYVYPGGHVFRAGDSVRFWMKRRRISSALVGVAVCAAICAALWPHARDAGAVVLAQDDPAELADAQITPVLRKNQALVAEQIEAALAAGDADLANSFVALAREKNIPLSDELSRRVDDAIREEDSSAHFAKRFATGLVTGNADDVASLSGTVAGDLFVFGDIRDVVREGKHLAMGEDTDRLVLGLATVGLAVTAATYVSVGGAAPVRAGLTLVKDARKVGRLGKGLAEWAGRSARDVVDTPALREAVASGSVLRPGATVSAIKAAFRAEKAGGLVRLGKDVGRVTEKVGARGALDTLKIADSPKDVARAARLAKAKGSQTRAILKILGRGALLLATGAFNLTLWLFSALLALFGFLSSIKATTERATQAWLDRKKARRLRKQTADARQPPMVTAAACG
jgi:ATP-dependent protease HslVU (ClpYQ) peptidase subunit